MDSPVGWYQILYEVPVTEDEYPHSEHLYTLAPTDLAHIINFTDDKAQINSPCAGWIPIYNHLSRKNIRLLTQEEVSSQGLETPLVEENVNSRNRGYSDVSNSSDTGFNLSSGKSKDLSAEETARIVEQLKNLEKELYGGALSEEQLIRIEQSSTDTETNTRSRDSMLTHSGDSRGVIGDVYTSTETAEEYIYRQRDESTDIPSADFFDEISENVGDERINRPLSLASRQSVIDDLSNEEAAIGKVQYCIPLRRTIMSIFVFSLKIKRVCESNSLFEYMYVMQFLSGMNPILKLLFSV